VNKGRIRLILTTNFDHLIEDALTAAAIQAQGEHAPSQVSLGARIYGAPEMSDRPVTLQPDGLV
jgi:hypothetical protein